MESHQERLKLDVASTQSQQPPFPGLGLELGLRQQVQSIQQSKKNR